MVEMKFLSEEDKNWWQSNQPKRKKPKPAKPRPKKRGRKPNNPSKNPKVKFNETAIGHFLYVYAPVEYYALMQLKELNIIRRKSWVPPFHVDEIEAICVSSGDPLFKKCAFRKALVNYKRYGLRPKKKAIWTANEAVYYAQYSSAIHKELKRCTEDK